jgi:tetratricopeptide (TPR) repeat protein
MATDDPPPPRLDTPDPAPPRALSRELVACALEKVLASRVLRASPQLRRFLAHVVHCSLTDDPDRLKEYTIAVEVFERGLRFDPNTDAIVRVEARRLREKLRAYYRDEGATDLVTIDIPSGAYRATFYQHLEPPAAILDDPYAVCQQAEALILRPTSDAIRRACHYLQMGIARWPAMSALHVMLAAATLTGVEMEYASPDEGIPLLRLAATRALRLNPDDGIARFYASIPDVRRHDKAAALDGAHQALRSSPSDPMTHYWVASVHAADLRMNEMFTHMQMAVRLQPHALFFQTWRAVCLFWMGNAAAAIRHLRDILAFEPDDVLANHWLGQVCAYVGRHDEGVDAARRAAALAPTTQVVGGLGFVEARAGHIEAADSILEALSRRAQTAYVASSRTAAIHAALGRLSHAADDLRRGQREGDWDLAWARGDARWDRLRAAVRGV